MAESDPLPRSTIEERTQVCTVTEPSFPGGSVVIAFSVPELDWCGRNGGSREVKTFVDGRTAEAVAEKRLALGGDLPEAF